MKTATVLTVPTISAAVSQVSPIAILDDQLFMCSAQVVTTGTSTGVAKLQASNDVIFAQAASGQPTHWFDIPGASVAVAGAGTVGIVKTELCYQYIRVVFTAGNAASGTITVNVQVAG